MKTKKLAVKISRKKHIPSLFTNLFSVNFEISNIWSGLCNLPFTYIKRIIKPTINFNWLIDGNEDMNEIKINKKMRQTATKSYCKGNPHS